MLPLPKHIAIVCTLSLLLVACQSSQVHTESGVNLPPAFDAAAAARDQTDIRSWWQHWHDPVLNRLIESALQGSPDIRIAQSRLQEALAISRLAQADFGPQAALQSNAAFAHGVADPEWGASPLARQFGGEQSANAGVVSATFAASWEPDLFGRKQSDADAAQHGALALQEQVHGAQMLVASTLADHYLQARALENRETNTERGIAALQRLHQYVQGRFQAGHVTRHEVDTVAGKLAAMQGKAATLRAERDAHVRAIAVLSGQVAQGFALPDSTADLLLHPVAAPGGQTPSGLLQRRPDLRGQAAKIRALAAKKASAEADLLPRITITFLGSGGRLDIDSNAPDLKGWGNLLGIGLQVPLFTHGRIAANIEAADARLQTALLEYDRTLLQALADVDNAYQAHQALQSQNQRLQEAHHLAQRAASDADKLFRYGNKTLDHTLSARLDEIDMAEKLVQAQQARAQMLIKLYKALGGGW